MGQIKACDSVAERNQETLLKYRDLYLGQGGQAAFEKHIANLPPEQQKNERRYLEQVRQVFSCAPSKGA